MSDLSKKIAIFTIVSNNYLHYARSLMESVRAHEPDCDRYVMVVDSPVAQEAIDDKALYSVVRLDELRIPEPGKFLFRYNVLEANTAVKPWVMEHLSAELGYKGVIYLDPDIYLYRGLPDVTGLLESGASLVLIPHLMGTIEDDRRPGERDILQAGTYNLGFAAIGNWTLAGPLVKWWQERLEHHCVVDPSNGLFVDQKWMDLATGLFPNVFILRHKGYNVAYWNLHERPVQKHFNEWTAGEQPLHFFHFSGLNVSDPRAFSKHQTRFTLDDIGDAKELVLGYCKRLNEHGASYFQAITYGFSQHEAGYHIPDAVRRLYRHDPGLEEAWGDDPFRVDLTPYLNEFQPAGDRAPRLTRLMRWVWRERQDLHEAFPNLETADRSRYVRWFLGAAGPELGMPDPWIEPAITELKGTERTPATRLRRRFPINQIAELFQLKGEPFVRRAYQIILGRPADYEGLTHFTESLKQNKVSRRRVLLAIAYSPEGRKRLRSLQETMALWLPVPLLKLFSLLSNSGPGLAARDASVESEESDRFDNDIGRLRLLPSIISGINKAQTSLSVVGYLNMSTGVGESARRFLDTAGKANIPVVPWTVELDGTINRNDSPPSTNVAEHRTPPITVLHINADQIPVLSEEINVMDGRKSYRIGYWHWELPEFPSKYFNAFRHVDEVWVPSDHMLHALTRVSPVPVVKIPHAIEVIVPDDFNREYFGIPHPAFAFLAMYDVCSYEDRKNPRGAIEAYRLAFPKPSDQQVLVVKANNVSSDDHGLNELLRYTEDRADIMIIAEDLNRSEVSALESAVDCFVSLHRAEGFGLCAAECMFLTKPVIATGWSGNMEFMTTENSYLVRYHMRNLSETIGPYEAGQYWAEPDLSHAANLMRLVRNNQSERERKARVAARDIKSRLSTRTIGRLYARRLRAIEETHNARIGFRQ